jgi:hypothetical protein
MLSDVPEAAVRTKAMVCALIVLGIAAFTLAAPAHALGKRPGLPKPPVPVKPRHPAESDPSARKTRITVTVLEPNGKPLNRAVVLVADGVPNIKPGHNGYFAINKACRVRRLMTDARGRATSPPLYPGTYHVMALPAGGGLRDAKGTIGSTSRIVVAVKDQTVNVTLNLRRGGWVTGEVLDDEKKPLAGAPLILRGGGFTLRGCSGPRGRFTFDGLHPGAYTLGPDRTDGLPISGAPVAIRIEEGKSTATKLHVEQSATLLVYVLRRGAGTKDAEVTLLLVRSNPGKAEAGEQTQGQRRVSVPKGKTNASFKDVSPGEYALLAQTSPGCRAEPARSVVVARGGRFATVRLAVVPGAAAPVAGSGTGSLNVKLTAPGKAPVKNVEFTVADSKTGKDVVRQRTDETGVSSFQLPAGEYRVRVSEASGWAVSPRSAVVSIHAGDSREAAFSATPLISEDF